MKRLVPAAVMGISSVTVLCAAATSDSDRAKVISLHAQVITPASDALFLAESQPPATTEEWEKVAIRAAELSRAAKGLESMESAKGQQAWLQFAHALGAAAERAVRAAQARIKTVSSAPMVKSYRSAKTAMRSTGMLVAA
jgi:hypothetical protein